MSFHRLFRHHMVALLLIILALTAEIAGLGEVIWAMNCGGEAHVDIHGIRYQRDSLPQGTASDYGKSLMIQRVVPQDQILYQTERYHTTDFGYEVPIQKDGDYVLVLKFSEVWFTAPNQKVFDVALNAEHSVVESLDIYGKVGRGVAHDEIIPFAVKNGKLKVGGETSDIDEKLLVQFIKGERDNPKINAIYVMRGRLDDVPQLAPLPGADQRGAEEEEEEEDLDEEMKREKRRRPASGPKVQNPYASDDTGSMMLPVFVAIGAFIPVLFCLCKL